MFLIWLLTIPSCSKKKNNDPGGNPPVVVNAEVTVLAAENNQVIEGFGCATVFAPPNTTPLTSEEFDRLFDSGNGQVGLNYLRIRIASDDAWRATELNHAKAAIQRGAKVFASPWSPPARMKTNNNIIGGKLIPDSAAAYAKYLNDFAVYMAPELVNNNQSYVNTILSDDAAVANLDILATHIYGGGIVENQTAKNKGKQVWMTEHLETETTYTANLNTAVEIHNCFTKANFNAYIWWYGKRFYGLVGQDGIVTKRGYIVSQFARFIKEGAIRLGSSPNSRPEVLISAYKNGAKKVVVAINTGAANVKQKITFQGASATSVVPYLTTLSKDAEQGAALTVTSDSFTYTLPPESVVTFVEQ